MSVRSDPTTTITHQGEAASLILDGTRSLAMPNCISRRATVIMHLSRCEGCDLTDVAAEVVCTLHPIDDGICEMLGFGAMAMCLREPRANRSSTISKPCMNGQWIVAVREHVCMYAHSYTGLRPCLGAWTLEGRYLSAPACLLPVHSDAVLQLCRALYRLGILSYNE